jgi:hypothetical protein
VQALCLRSTVTVPCVAATTPGLEVVVPGGASRASAAAPGASRPACAFPYRRSPSGSPHSRGPVLVHRSHSRWSRTAVWRTESPWEAPTLTASPEPLSRLLAPDCPNTGSVRKDTSRSRSDPRQRFGGRRRHLSEATDLLKPAVAPGGRPGPLPRFLGLKDGCSRPLRRPLALFASALRVSATIAKRVGARRLHHRSPVREQIETVVSPRRPARPTWPAIRGRQRHRVSGGRSQDGCQPRGNGARDQRTE